MVTGIKYVDRVKSLISSPGNYVVYLMDHIGAITASHALFTDGNTTSNCSIGNLKNGDKVMVKWDKVTSIILSIMLQNSSTVAASTVAKASPTHGRISTGVVRGGPQRFTTQVVYLNLFSPQPGSDPNVIYRIAIKLIGGSKVYKLLLHSGTVIPSSGLVSIAQGDIIEVTYDSAGWVHKIDFVRAKAEEHPASDSKPAPEPKVVTEPLPRDWVNLCQAGLMHSCTGENPKERRTCHFWEKHSQGVSADCSHYREGMANACDCVLAHIHLSTYGPAEEGVVERKEPEESWDELLMKRFGRKV